MTDDDTPDDHLTVATDPYVGVTRGENGTVKIHRADASIPVDGADVPALVDALEAFATPVSAASGRSYGGAPGLEQAAPDADDDDLLPKKICPDCGAPTREGLGGRACPECGWCE